MNRAAALAALLLLAGCQAAPKEVMAPQTKPSVPTLAGPQLSALIVGKALGYNHYGAVSSFFADGRYGYRDYEVRDRGSYAISGDTVCITFEDGGRRCDRYAQIGDDYYRIEEGGRQTKIDAIKPAGPTPSGDQFAPSGASD